MTEIWYSYKDFIFTKEQVLWALEHWLELSAGNWPKEPIDSGYTDILLSPSYGRTKTEGSFVKSITIKTEISWRLSRCKVEGKLLMAEVRGGVTFGELSSEARSALAYCSGWRRRTISFKDFCRSHRYRQNVTKTVTSR